MKANYLDYRNELFLCFECWTQLMSDDFDTFDITLLKVCGYLLLRRDVTPVIYLIMLIIAWLLGLLSLFDLCLSLFFLVQLLLLMLKPFKQ